MSPSTSPEQERDELIDSVLRAARQLDALVIVGNGDTARRVGSRCTTESIVLLEGAMGMAAAVASGYARFSSRPLMVIEGDGNRLLGSPAAEWLATLDGSILYIVFVNGILASSGGQPLAVNISNLRDQLRQSQVVAARDLPQVIYSWSLNPTSVFIHVKEGPARLQLPPRPSASLYDLARAIITQSRRRR